MRLVMRPPRPWWNALARGHEQRREAAQAMRLATSCDLPLFGLGEEWPGNRDVRLGRCRATFRHGPFGLRVQVGPVVVDEITAHHEATGHRVLNVTTYRPGEADPARSHLVSTFLSISWVLDEARAAEDDPPDSARPPATAAPTGWQPVVVPVDGEEHLFERLSMEGHWLALGTVGAHAVAVEAHGLPAEVLALQRLRDLPAWVRSPASTAANRPIIELGDRLGDLFGLP